MIDTTTKRNKATQKNIGTLSQKNGAIYYHQKERGYIPYFKRTGRYKNKKKETGDQKDIKLFPNIKKL